MFLSIFFVVCEMDKKRNRFKNRKIKLEDKDCLSLLQEHL